MGVEGVEKTINIIIPTKSLLVNTPELKFNILAVHTNSMKPPYAYTCMYTINVPIAALYG